MFVNICILEYDEVIFVKDKCLTKRSLNVTPARKPTVSEAKLKIKIIKINPIFLKVKKSYHRTMPQQIMERFDRKQVLECFDCRG